MILEFVRFRDVNMHVCWEVSVSTAMIRAADRASIAMATRMQRLVSVTKKVFAWRPAAIRDIIWMGMAAVPATAIRNVRQWILLPSLTAKPNTGPVPVPAMRPGSVRQPPVPVHACRERPASMKRPNAEMLV